MERGGRARGQAGPVNPKWAKNRALGPFQKKKIHFLFIFQNNSSKTPILSSLETFLQDGPKIKVY
jgi:hypothetical protein